MALSSYLQRSSGQPLLSLVKQLYSLSDQCEQPDKPHEE